MAFWEYKKQQCFKDYDKSKDKKNGKEGKNITKGKFLSEFLCRPFSIQRQKRQMKNSWFEFGLFEGFFPKLLGMENEQKFAELWVLSARSLLAELT